VLPDRRFCTAKSAERASPAGSGNHIRAGGPSVLLFWRDMRTAWSVWCAPATDRSC